MQLYVAEYLADTTHLSAAQHGAYLLLLMNYWQRGKALKNSNERLANVARMSNEEWNANREVLAEFFEVTDEEWIHRRVERDLEQVAVKSGKASAAGRASAEARANKRSTSVEQTLPPSTNETSTKIQPLRTEQNRTDKDKSHFVLPDWISPESWKGYEDMRKRIRKPMTDRARNLAIADLETLRSHGEDPAAVLDQSTMNGWQGLFELRRTGANGHNAVPIKPITLAEKMARQVAQA